jgi:uncharacterized DUF497 family protein
MEFEWDDNKAASNLAKHGIEFSQAIAVFEDPDQVTEDDVRRDYGELRQNTIGLIGPIPVVVVTHTNRSGVTRLISARPASRDERRKYYGKNN